MFLYASSYLDLIKSLLIHMLVRFSFPLISIFKTIISHMAVHVVTLLWMLVSLGMLFTSFLKRHCCCRYDLCMGSLSVFLDVFSMLVYSLFGSCVWKEKSAENYCNWMNHFFLLFSILIICLQIFNYTMSPCVSF